MTMETMDSLESCPLCHSALAKGSQDDQCTSCGAPSRTRALAPVLSRIFTEGNIPTEAQLLPLLGFAMTKNERTLLQPYYKEFVSVSLYGNYGAGHTTGVDVCDLGRYPDSSFAAVFSILLFDYVIELPRALTECRRVLHDSGIFITSVAPYRLLDGRAPLTHKVIEKRPDYFSYLPDGAQMPSIKIGRETFLDLMESAGLRATHLRVADQQSGAFSEWFIGHPKTLHGSREEQEAGVTRSGSHHNKPAETEA